MSVFLNTSVIIRYLTGDHPEMSDRASAIYTFDRRFPSQGIEIRQTL